MHEVYCYLQIFLNDNELCNINYIFKFTLQKLTNLFFSVKCYNE